MSGKTITRATQSIKLDGVSYNNLFTFNGTNADDVNPFIESFSMHALPEPLREWADSAPWPTH